MSAFRHDQQPSILLVLTLIFLLMVAGGVVDLILDRPTTLLTPHVAFEVLMVGLSLGAASYLGLGWYQSQTRLIESSMRSKQLERERARWEEEASSLLRGLGPAVSSQFDAWSLTPTERRVALLLLKGLSHKRIARTSQSSERTVRQHAVSVYRKSGLSGRAELSGFFLQPLLLPEDIDAGEGAERA